MARNSEKQLTRLNRFLLQKEHEDYLKKNPIRPKLSTLNSVTSIQKWLPSIKKDITFNLEQSKVPCYPERKIKEFYSEIDRLKGEYQAFIRKLKQLDPTLDVIPWTERSYVNQKRCLSQDNENLEIPTKTSKVNEESNSENNTMPSTKRKFTPIVTPILLHDEKNPETIDSHTYTSTFENDHLQDQPLTFNTTNKCPSLPIKNSTDSKPQVKVKVVNPCGIQYSSSDSEID